MYFKIGALKNFENFTGKMNVLESLFKKVSGPQTCKFIKRRLQHKYFPVKLERFSSTLFREHFRWLVFKISNSNILFKDFSRTPLRHSKSLITCNSHNDKLNLKMHSLTKNFFCNRFRTNSKGSDLNINNFAVLFHCRITQIFNEIQWKYIFHCPYLIFFQLEHSQLYQTTEVFLAFTKRITNNFYHKCTIQH